MDTGIFRQGNSVFVTVPASSQISIYTKGRALVWQLFAAPGQSPPTVATGPVSLLTTVTNGTPYQSATFSAITYLMIESWGEYPTFYNIGVTPISLTAVGMRYQGTPGTLNATGTLTAALIYTRIVTSTTGAAVAATLDTGTVMDASAVWAVGDSFDWAVINTGGNTFTVTAAAGHTIVGVAAVVTVTSAIFRTRKTAANTFVTYRLAG